VSRFGVSVRCLGSVSRFGVSVRCLGSVSRFGVSVRGFGPQVSVLPSGGGFERRSGKGWAIVRGKVREAVRQESRGAAPETFGGRFPKACGGRLGESSGVASGVPSEQPVPSEFRCRRRVWLRVPARVLGSGSRFGVRSVAASTFLGVGFGKKTLPTFLEPERRFLFQNVRNSR